MTRIALALATALLAGSLVGVAPASAESGSLSDAAGDAPPRSDVLMLRARNAKVLKIVVSLERLERRRTSVYAIVAPDSGDERAYIIGWSQNKDFPRHRVFARVTRTDAKSKRCRGLKIKVDTAADKLRLSVPQRCLGKASEQVKITALTETASGRDIDDTRVLRLARG